MFIELSILFLSICLIITIFIALCYFGLFEPIEVKTGESPYILGGKKFIYKTYRAETTNIGSDFTKLTNLLSSFQDSSLVPTLITQPQGSEPTKSFLGVIFEKGNDDAEQLLISKDYKIMTLPQVDHTVSVIFPNRGSISVAIGLKRVYPAITNYIRIRRLTHDQLMHFTLGSYQLHRALGYYAEHASPNGEFLIQLYKDTISIDLSGTNVRARDPVLIRARIQSRHSSNTKHITYVLFDRSNPQNIHHICSCKSGMRTVGCCAHIATLIWYLCYARYQDSINITREPMQTFTIHYESEDEDGDGSQD